MNTEQHFKLIDGTFTAADAQLVIQRMYNEKIQFHNRMLLKIRENNAGDIQATERKIAELEETSKQVSKFLKDNLEQRVEVKGALVLSVINKG